MSLFTIDKNDLLLLLLYSKGKSGSNNEPIVGITRLMKLLFLLNKEQNLNQFSFEPYKMGPFSGDVYPELDFLQNFPSPEKPFVEVKNNNDSTSGVTPESLKMVDDAQESDAYLNLENVNKTFYLSDLGIKVADEIWKSIGEENQSKIEKIKSQYGSLTLKEPY